MDITLRREGDNYLLEVLRKEEVDLLLLDMNMPGISGAELITRVRAESQSLPILVLSMHNEPRITRRALATGAAGYLTKGSDPETLLAAIRKVAAGSTACARSRCARRKQATA